MNAELYTILRLLGLQINLLLFSLPATTSVGFLLNHSLIRVVGIGVHLVSSFTDLLALAEVVHVGDPLPGLPLRLHHDLLDLRVGRGHQQLAAEEADTTQDLG